MCHAHPKDSRPRGGGTTNLQARKSSVLVGASQFVSCSGRKLAWFVCLLNFSCCFFLASFPRSDEWNALSVSVNRPGCLLNVSTNLCRSQSQSHITTDGRSVSMSRYRAHSGTYFLSEGCFLKVAVGRPLWREVGSVICLSQSSNSPVFTSNIYFTCVLQFSNLYTIYIKLISLCGTWCMYMYIYIYVCVCVCVCLFVCHSC
jgi:hypothetical protein